MKHTLFLLVLLILAQSGNAQRYLGIAIECGYDHPIFSDPNSPYVRRDVSPFMGSAAYNNNDKPSGGRIFAGVKLMTQTSNKKFSLGSGIRFTTMQTRTANTMSYILIDQSATTADYVQASDVRQTSFYIGIPLELRYFPLRAKRTFRPYFTAAVVNDFKVHTQTTMTIDAGGNSNTYQQAAIRQIESSGVRSVALTSYAGIGFEAGKKPIFRLEITSLLFTSNHMSSLAEFKAGGIGIRMHLQILSNNRTSK